ncbi:MAG: hypothetical protein IPM77_03775 [Crocinitomicaceae bacterium]|nr:hypothetical protein [Crocinitomicaceae bacterium]
MKPLFILAIGILILFGFDISSNAQSNIYKITEYDFSPVGIINKEFQENQRMIIQEKRVKSRNCIQKVNGEITSVIYEEFDRAGNMIYRKHTNPKGVIVDEVVRNFDQNNNCIYAKHTFDGKYTEVWNNYNDSSRITMSKQYNEKREYEARIYEYDEAGTQIQKVTLYKLDSLAPVKWMTYFYHEDGSKKQIDYFNQGELVYSWKYECSEKGELVVHKSDTASMICTKTSVDDNGNTLKWTQDLNGGGQLITHLSVYSSKGRLKEIAKYYSLSDQLIDRTLFFEDGGTMTLSYDKKGAGRVVSETVYDIDGQMIYSVFGYGKNNPAPGQIITTG